MGNAVIPPTEPIDTIPVVAEIPVTLQAEDISSLPPWGQKLIADARKEAADRRGELRTAQEKAVKTEQERLAQAGQWQTLAEQRALRVTELEAQAARAAAIEQTIVESNNRRISGLPESVRSLVPSAYDPVMLAKWLDTATPMLAQRRAPNLDAGTSGEAVQMSDLTGAEITIAKSLGITPAQYAARKRKVEQV